MLGADPWTAPRAGATASASCCRSPRPRSTSRSASACSSTPATTRAPRDVDDTIALVGLAEQAEQQATQLSGGQRRRLDVALALIGDPELIFLDEPTTGFDPAARRAAWEVIAGLRALGTTILLTTHYMEEAERLADRIVVMRDGVIVADRDARDARRPRPRRPRSSRSRCPTASSSTRRARRVARRGPPRRREQLRADGRPARADRRALALGLELARPRGPPADPGGRLPGADPHDRHCSSCTSCASTCSRIAPQPADAVLLARAAAAAARRPRRACTATRRRRAIGRTADAQQAFVPGSWRSRS